MVVTKCGVRLSPDEIRSHIEKLMGWKEGESVTLSFTALRNLVRGRDPKFDLYFASYIEQGLHWFIKDSGKRRRYDY